MSQQSIPQLYSSLHSVLMQQIQDECESRLSNLIWLMMGIFLSRSVQLPLVARKVPLRVKKLSLVQRFRRFLANGSVRVRPWYSPTAQAILVMASQGGMVHLIIDGSKVSGRHQCLMVAVAYRRRALPVAWTWVKGSRGYSSTKKQLKLLGYLNRLIPQGARVSLVGDSEFGNPLVLEYLDSWGWQYALRQAGDNLVMLKGSDWQRLDSLPLARGQVTAYPHVVLTRASSYPTHLTLCWKRTEPKPWLLATSCRSALTALRLYRRRMWIEELFGDLKGHGFDLENSHLRHFLRLSRLTLVVCLLYVWLIALSHWVISHGLTDEVDRSDRRDLSIFRLGWDFLERRLVLFDPIPSVSLSNFCSL